MATTVRRAQPVDAESILSYLTILSEEPHNNLPMSPGEVRYTVEEERELIQKWNSSPNALMLIAASEDAGAVVGVTTLHGSQRRAMRHAVELGISVHPDHRGQGLGTTMLTQAVAWAREGGVIKRIELHVYCRNAGAIRLYERFGFRIEGRLQRAIFEDGRYLDNDVMALLI